MNNISFKTKFILTVVTAFLYGSSIACTCLYMGTFEEFATEHPVIIKGTVQEYGEQLHNRSGYFQTMSIAVSESIKGSFPHSRLELFGDTGMSCLRYISSEDYPIGSEHLFILESDELVQPLMVCGEASVQITGETVTGHSLHSGYRKYERNLDEFLAQIR